MAQMKLQDLINEELNNELADIRYKSKFGAPAEFTSHQQGKVSAFQWVLDIIERHGAKGNFELDDDSLEKSRADRN